MKPTLTIMDNLTAKTLNVTSLQDIAVGTGKGILRHAFPCWDTATQSPTIVVLEMGVADALLIVSKLTSVIARELIEEKE
jgi:hypothetical protein